MNIAGINVMIAAFVCGVAGSSCAALGSFTLPTADQTNFATSIATALGVAVAIVALWLQLRAMNRQVMIQQFSDYTKRYQDLLLQLPESINDADFDILKSPQVAKYMRRVRAYFDLCYEEWFLNRHKLIRDFIWREWEAGMTAAFKRKMLADAWMKKIRIDTRYDVEFIAFVDSLMCKPKKGS